MSADDTSTLVNQFIASVASSGEASEVAAGKIADNLASGSLSLLQFIQVLGPTLTSEDLSTRTYSLHCLSTTLRLLKKKVNLTNQDVNVLLQFLVKKLEDEKITAHTLAALTSLIQFKKFLPRANDSLINLTTALTNMYDPRKHLAKVRYEGFQLLRVLFDLHHETIFSTKEFLEAFAEAFIHVASGEKDPRNLLMSFRLNVSVNEKFSFDDRTTNASHDQILTDLFDVCFCYFPISFSPPPNDPYKISAEDLKRELRKTIASQTQFAKDTFPALFEKLTSTNPTVRNDVLQTLHLCAQNYTVATLREYWITIWDALKFEVLHNDVLVFRPETSYIIPPNVEQIEDSDNNKSLFLTLQTLSAIVQRLSESDELIDALIQTVHNDLRRNLESQDSKTVKQSVIIMSALASVSSKVFNSFVEFLFSFEVWGKYVRSDIQEKPENDENDMEVDISLTVARQRDLIDNLGFVFTASMLLDTSNDLITYKDHLLIFMGQLLQTSSKLDKTLKCKITQQLVKLILLKDFLVGTEVLLILGWLNENLVSAIQSNDRGWEKDIFVKEIISGIVHILSEGSENKINENVNCVIEIILPTLLDNYTDAHILEIINKLCVNYKILEVLSIRLLNKIAYEELDRERFCGILDCLINSFNQTQSVKPFMTNTWYKNFVPRFLDLLVQKSGDDAAVLEMSGRLLGLIVRYTEKSHQQSILNDTLRDFWEKPGSALNVLDAPAPKIAILKHILAKVDKECKFPYPVHEKVQENINLAMKAEALFVRVGYLQTIALLVNKFTKQNDESNSEILNNVFSGSHGDINSLEFATWILKGLITRIDQVGLFYLRKLLDEVFASEDISYSRQTSKCFNILMADLDIFSNPENTKIKIISGVVNLNVKLLYKQQSFEIILDRILKEFETIGSDERKEVLLGTLAIVIGNISSKILRPHLGEVFPMVLNGLSIQNSIILRASLDTFKVIISETPELISENIDSLLAKLVDLCTSKIIVNKCLVNDEKIRVLALECLEGIFKEMEHPQIIKYQATTRDKLKACLDDKKRSVRKKACDVRQHLYDLGR